MTVDYTYYGMLASTWDLWRDNTANWSDRNLFLEIIKQYGQPALDIGCGTGRLVIDYQQEGIDTDGIDNSPEMIAITQAKAEKLNLTPNLYVQDMLTLDLPRRYRVIIGSSSVLQLLTNIEDARLALRRFYDHLEPGGVFITPFFFDWTEGEALDTGWELLFEKPRPEDGAIVRSHVREWREPEKQWWHTEQRFEVELNGEIIAREEQKRSPEGRWYTQPEAVALYEEIGFTNIQLLKAFAMEPADPDDRQFCVLGVKPE